MPGVAANDAAGASGALVLDRGYVGGAAMKARMDLILDVMKSVMKEGTDFGTVPGTQKPSLWQPGADKLCVAFQITPKVERVDDLTTEDEIRYRVTVSGIHQGTGVHLADGIGEASTNEEKYRWRRTYIQEEFDETPADRKRKKWKEGRDGRANYFEMQIRTSPADVANTVLKMAVKRAKIAMVLAATGAAAIFTQDLEDLPEEVAKAVAAEEVGPDRKRPQRASERSVGKSGEAPQTYTTDPVLVKALTKKERQGKDPYWLVKASDGNEYSTFDSARVKELEGFVGTDHKVRIQWSARTYENKTFRTLVTFAIADDPAAPAKQSASQPVGQAAQPQQLTADEIFGGK